MRHLLGDVIKQLFSCFRLGLGRTQLLFLVPIFLSFSPAHKNVLSLKVLQLVSLKFCACRLSKH